MGLGVREEDNLAILSLKKSRKDWARHDVEIEVGRIIGVLRERRDCSVDHSFLGCLDV